MNSVRHLMHVLLFKATTTLPPQRGSCQLQLPNDWCHETLFFSDVLFIGAGNVSHLLNSPVAREHTPSLLTNPLHSSDVQPVWRSSRLNTLEDLGANGNARGNVF